MSGAAELGRNPGVTALEPAVEVGVALTVARREFAQVVLGVRGVVLALGYAAVLLGAGRFYFWAVGEIERKVRETAPVLDQKTMFAELTKNPEFQKSIVPLLETLGGEPLRDAVLAGRLPFVFLVLVAASAMVLPPLVLVVGYDRLSDDLHSRHVRFLLPRVRRETLILGKWLGLSGGVAAIVLVVQLALVALGLALVPTLEPGAMAQALPLMLVGTLVFVGAYAALVTFLSTVIAPPIAALLLGGLAMMGLWFAQLGSEGVRAVWMGSRAIELWLLDPLALFVFVGHTLVFLVAAGLVLRAKDV